MKPFNIIKRIRMWIPVALQTDEPYATAFERAESAALAIDEGRDVSFATTELHTELTHICNALWSEQLTPLARRVFAITNEVPV
tara:strand:- start:24734 stop:24985 length:252 start_codon:yes stop_codon:yes gene_type:complete